MANKISKKKKKEQDNIITAQVIGMGIGLAIGFLLLVLLIYVIGTNGTQEVQNIVNQM